MYLRLWSSHLWQGSCELVVVLFRLLLFFWEKFLEQIALLVLFFHGKTFYTLLIYCSNFFSMEGMKTVTFKGTPVGVAGEFPKVGAKAPDFRLVNRELADRSLHDFQGKKKVLLLVPSLDTSVCSTMAKKFNEKVAAHPEVSVLLISADLPFAQHRFCTVEGMKNITPLSMMRDKSFGKDYGVLIAEGPLEGILARAVLILDQSDQIVYAQLVDEITDEPDYDAALSYLV